MNVKTKIITIIILVILSLSTLVIHPVYVVDNISNEQKSRIGNTRQDKVFITGKLQWRIKNGN